MKTNSRNLLLISLMSVGILILAYVIFRIIRNSLAKPSKTKEESKLLTKAREVYEIVLDEFPDTWSNDDCLMVVAQSAFETGGWNIQVPASVYLKNNNLFGMRDAHQRPEDSLNDFDGDGYANYASESQSIHDFLLWCEYTKMEPPFKSVGQYVNDLLDRHYYEAPLPTYLKGVTTYYDEFKAAGL